MYYTVKDVARRAGTSGAYIRKLCSQGVIKAEKIGRDWLIDKASADQWLAERAAES